MYFLCLRKIHNLVLVTLLFEKQLYWDMIHMPWKPPFSSIQSVVFCIFSKVCNHYHNLILDNFITPKRNSIPIKSPFPPQPTTIPNPKQSPIYFWLLWISFIWTFLRNGIIQCTIATLWGKFFHIFVSIQYRWAFAE